MQDKELKCIDCKRAFFFTEKDQQFYKEQNFKEPKRCYDCRVIKKAKFNNAEQ